MRCCSLSPHLCLGSLGALKRCTAAACMHLVILHCSHPRPCPAALCICSLGALKGWKTMFGHLLSKERLPFAGGACPALKVCPGCRCGLLGVCGGPEVLVATIAACIMAAADAICFLPGLHPPCSPPHCSVSLPPAPAAYFGSLLATLYVSFVMHSYIFSLLFCVAQASHYCQFGLFGADACVVASVRLYPARPRDPWRPWVRCLACSALRSMCPLACCAAPVASQLRNLWLGCPCRSSPWSTMWPPTSLEAQPARRCGFLVECLCVLRGPPTALHEHAACECTTLLCAATALLLAHTPNNTQLLLPPLAVGGQLCGAGSALAGQRGFPSVLQKLAAPRMRLAIVCVYQGVQLRHAPSYALRR